MRAVGARLARALFCACPSGFTDVCVICSGLTIIFYFADFEIYISGCSVGAGMRGS